MVLSPYDQSVYDAGYKYIPQSQYLLNPFKLPGDGSVENDTFRQPTGIASLGGSGGGGFNPYNADMSNVRQDYRPDFDFRRYSEYGFNPSTMDRKQMDMNQEYFYDRPSAMQQKIGGLMNFIPGLGTLKRGAEFIGGALKGILPENQRAIMENQARGAGIFTDDIGRVVSSGGDINTGANIMAGYNLNKVTPETIQKRRDMINRNMKDPAQKEAKLKALDEFEEMYFGPYGVNKKTKDIITFREQKKQREEAQRIQDELAAAAEAKSRAQALAAIKKQGRADYNPNIHGPTDYGRDSGGNQSFDFGGGFGIGSDGGPVSNRTGRGRTGYMLGGLTDLVDIYD